MNKIKLEQIFLLVLILLDLGTAWVYAFQNDLKKAVCRIGIAVLNLTSYILNTGR